MVTNRTAAMYPSGLQGDTDSMILRKYYQEHDYPLSPEGIMKVISVILCIVSSVVLLSGGACTRAALAAGGAALALAAAALLALLYAAAALALRAHAPLLCLFTDLVVSTVIGVLLLVSAVLSMTLCTLTRGIEYVHGPLSIVTAGCVLGSAVLAYAAATRRWDAARPARVAPRPPLAEHDV